jgi:hypothetical protein
MITVRARSDVPSSKLTPKGQSLARQLRGAFRDHDVSTKLPGLGIGTFGQVPARNPHWKSKVVFDIRARARLASGRTALEDERIESFGSRVDRGRKASRSAANDDEVAQVIPVDAHVEAETVGDLLIAWPPEHG